MKKLLLIGISTLLFASQINICVQAKNVKFNGTTTDEPVACINGNSFLLLKGGVGRSATGYSIPLTNFKCSCKIHYSHSIFSRNEAIITLIKKGN